MFSLLGEGRTRLRSRMPCLTSVTPPPPTTLSRLGEGCSHSELSSSWISSRSSARVSASSAFSTTANPLRFSSCGKRTWDSESCSCSILSGDRIRWDVERGSAALSCLAPPNRAHRSKQARGGEGGSRFPGKPAACRTVRGRSAPLPTYRELSSPRSRQENLLVRIQILRVFDFFVRGPKAHQIATVCYTNFPSIFAENNPTAARNGKLHVRVGRFQVTFLRLGI